MGNRVSTEILVQPRISLQTMAFFGCGYIAFAGFWAFSLSAMHGFMLNLFPEGRIAEFMGYHFLIMSLGRIAGPLISGAIIDNFSFGTAFLTASIFALTGLILLQQVHEGRERLQD